MNPKSTVASLLLVLACSYPSLSEASPSKVLLPVSKLELNVPAGQNWTATAEKNGKADRVTIREFGLPIAAVDLELHPQNPPSKVACISYLVEWSEMMKKDHGSRIRTVNKPSYLPRTWSQDSIEYAPAEPGLTHGWVCTAVPNAVVRARISFSTGSERQLKAVLAEVARVGKRGW